MVVVGCGTVPEPTSGGTSDATNVALASSGDTRPPTPSVTVDLGTVPESTTTSIEPWPAETTTTLVLAGPPPSTTESPRPSPASPGWAPAIVLTPTDHPGNVSVSVGDTIGLIVPVDQADPEQFFDRNYPQDSFGVDADLLRVASFGGVCPSDAVCAAWVAVDAGTTTIQPPAVAYAQTCVPVTACAGDNGSTTVTIGIGDHPLQRVGQDADGSSIVVPVGSIVDVHLDEVNSRMYKPGDALTPEYWQAPTATTVGVVEPIGQDAPTRCQNGQLGVHDCLSLLATQPGMTTLSFESRYTCDLGDCNPEPTYRTRTFTLSIVVTPS
jgi:hypothetical protein